MVSADVREETETDESTQNVSLMEKYLDDPENDYRSLKYGDVMDGVIMRIDRDEILVDIGSKSEGVVPSKEFSSLSPRERDELNVGDTILVFIVQPENREGQPVVSIDRARQEKSWRRLQEIFDEGGVIEAEVVNYNKGGLLVNLDGVRGFVPASQVTIIRGADEMGKQTEMAKLIGSSLPLKVIEINRHRNRLILSERQAMQEKRDEMKDQLIKELIEGEVRPGRVSSICDFGAFVDIGGADGLVHLSELSWSRVRHPSEVLKVGDEIDVFVLGINASDRKIALSIKRTQVEPWSQVADKYDVGQLVRGTVTQLANFGAFARILDGIEGLVHVSELSEERIAHPKQVVNEGQDLILRIIRIDPERRRMGLSLRRALDTPDEELIIELGEEAVAERDAIAVQVAASLERERLIAEAEAAQAAEEALEDEGDAEDSEESGVEVEASDSDDESEEQVASADVEVDAETDADAAEAAVSEDARGAADETDTSADDASTSVDAEAGEAPAEEGEGMEETT